MKKLPYILLILLLWPWTAFGVQKNLYFAGPVGGMMTPSAINQGAVDFNGATDYACVKNQTDYFTGDFSINFDYTLTTSGDTGDYGMFFVLANAATMRSCKAHETAKEAMIVVYAAYQDATHAQLRCYEVSTTPTWVQMVDGTVDYYNMLEGERVYFTLYRTGTQGGLRLYDDSARTNQIGHFYETNMVSGGMSNFDIAYCASEYASDAGGNVTGTVYNVDIGDGGDEGVISLFGANGTLAAPHQNSVMDDGRFIGCLFDPDTGTGTATNVIKMNWIDSQDLWGYDTNYHSAPLGSMYTTIDQFDVASNMFQYGYGTWEMVAYGSTSLIAANAYKPNDSLTTTSVMTDNGTSVDLDETNTFGYYPSIAVNSDDWVWIAARKGTDPYYISVRKAYQPYYMVGTWPASASIKDLNTGNAVPQLVSYFNTSYLEEQDADIGCGYSQGWDLYFKYYDEVDGWGSEEQVFNEDNSTDSLAAFNNFRFIVLQDNTTVALWKDEGEETEIHYSVRSAGPGQSWSAPADFCTDTANNDFQWTATADVGKPHRFYVIYANTDGDIGSRYLDIGSSVQGFVTLDANASLQEDYICAPSIASDRIPVYYVDAWPTNSVSNILRMKIIDLDPTPVGVDGTLMSDFGQSAMSTYVLSRHSVSYGNLTFIMILTKDQICKGMVINHSTMTPVGGWVDLAPYRMWDKHNIATLAMADGYVYFALGGRNFEGGSEAILVYKSKSGQTLDTFASDWTVAGNFDNISPGGTGGGYKYYVADNSDGVGNEKLHQIFRIDCSTDSCYEVKYYDGTSWSSGLNILRFDPGGGTAWYSGFWHAVMGDVYCSDQKSIHLFYAQSVPGGLCLELYYMQLFPAPSDSGTHTGANDAAILTDSGASWTVDSLIGLTVNNETDVSSCVITDNDATTVTCTLSGGTDNNWDTDDVYSFSGYVAKHADGNCHLAANCPNGGTNEGALPVDLQGDDPGDGDGVNDGDLVDDAVVGGYSIMLGGDCVNLDNGNPGVVYCQRSSVDPYPITKLKYAYWTDSAWSIVTVDDTSTFPQACAPSIAIDGESNIIITCEALDGSNISQVYQYVSTSQTSPSFTKGPALTSSTYNCSTPRILGLAEGHTMLWHEMVSFDHSEVRFSSEALATANLIPFVNGGLINSGPLNVRLVH